MTLELSVVLAADGYEFVRPLEPENFERIFALRGLPIGTKWSPIEMRFARRDDRGRVLEQADFPSLGTSTLIMRESARAALGDIWARSGKLLPAQAGKTALFILNAISVSVNEALDLHRSDVWRFDDGTITNVRRPWFRSGWNPPCPIFRLDLRGSATFVDPAFVEAVSENGLTGLSFKKIWPVRRRTLRGSGDRLRKGDR